MEQSRVYSQAYFFMSFKVKRAGLWRVMENNGKQAVILHCPLNKSVILRIVLLCLQQYIRYSNEVFQEL